MKHIIQTSQSPQAIGPYSQAVQYNGLIVTSGQIALNADGKLIGGGIKEQTKQVMHNLASVLKAGNSDFSKVIKSTIYLKDMNDFAKVNEVYGSYFTHNPPARSTVEVSRLPKDVLVEIDMIAIAQ